MKLTDLWRDATLVFMLALAIRVGLIRRDASGERLEAVGPEVGSFLMAHERGHIHLKHTRANALLAGKSALDSVLQGRELAADCYAARTLGQEHRVAVIAAVRFFGRLGSVHFDAAHPSGAQRAATILSCLPADSGGLDSSLAPGEKRRPRARSGGAPAVKGGKGAQLV